MFFEQFNLRWHTFPDDSQHLITNICQRVAASADAKTNQTVLYEYEIEEGETPDIISNKLYGTPNYWWVICLINNVHDMVNDWPMTYDEIEELIARRYPTDDAEDAHHYELPDGSWTTPQAQMTLHGITSEASAIAILGLNVVSIRDHENAENDKRAKIKVVRDKYITQFAVDLGAAFSV